MIAVIFELEPKNAEKDNYFSIAMDLKPLLKTIDGFISVERFQSLVNPEKYLSLSFWRDEEAVQQWRELTNHRQAQQSGRENIFSDYRLRVAQVIRDYGLQEREQAPADSVSHHG